MVNQCLGVELGHPVLGDIDVGQSFRLGVGHRVVNPIPQEKKTVRSNRTDDQYSKKRNDELLHRGIFERLGEEWRIAVEWNDCRKFLKQAKAHPRFNPDI